MFELFRIPRLRSEIPVLLHATDRVRIVDIVTLAYGEFTIETLDTWLGEFVNDSDYFSVPEDYQPAGTGSGLVLPTTRDAAPHWIKNMPDGKWKEFWMGLYAAWRERNQINCLGRL